MSPTDAPRDSFHQQYADILPTDREDPALTVLARDLDAFMAAPAPASAQRRIGREALAQASARYQEVDQRPTRAATGDRPARRRARRAYGPAWARAGARRFATMAAVTLLALVALSGGTAFAVTHLDPGLRFQLGVPVASGPRYTDLHVTHEVGDLTVTLAKVAFTSKKVIIGFTYDWPADKPNIGACPVSMTTSLTSREGDTFRAFAVDSLPEGANGGVAHGSTVLYFSVVHLQGDQGERYLQLLLHPCDSTRADDGVAFDFTAPLQ